MKEQKHISKSIKHFFIKAILTFIQGLNRIIKAFFNLLKILVLKPLKAVFLLFYKYVVINLYKIFYLLTKIKRQLLPDEKIEPVYVFINKYITHLILIILVISISFTNFLTNETRAEGIGEKSVLFALATGGNPEEEYVEETLDSSQSKITSYLESQTTTVSANQQVLTDEQNTSETSESAITGDNTALVKPELSSIEASKKQRDKIIEYTVKDGDTISSIAQNFNVSTETILWENNLGKNSFIRPGQTLNILPTNGVSYKIAANDTLAKIAKKYQADTNKIIEFNQLFNETDIQAGQVIIIPEGQPYYPPVSTSPKLASISKIFTPTHVDVPVGEKMAWPTTARRISQYFNWRHVGLDIDGEFGDPIWAAEDGTIIKVAYMKSGYGYHVIIDHGNGKQTLYGHFQKIYVEQGQKVSRGDVLGEMGSTGYSTGSHLHLEVRINGKKYNPLSYIK